MAKICSETDLHNCITEYIFGRYVLHIAVREGFNKKFKSMY